MTFFRAIKDSDPFYQVAPLCLAPKVTVEVEKLSGVRSQHSLSREMQTLLQKEVACLPKELHEPSNALVGTRGIRTEVDPEGFGVGWGPGNISKSRLQRVD